MGRNLIKSFPRPLETLENYLLAASVLIGFGVVPLAFRLYSGGSKHPYLFQRIVLLH
jgi:hypothetical protein